MALDPKKNYLFGYHPHGVISMGALVNFAYCFVAHIFRDKTSQRQDAEEEAYDTRYGPEKLTHKRILDTVGDKSEPIFYLSGGWEEEDGRQCAQRTLDGMRAQYGDAAADVSVFALTPGEGLSPGEMSSTLNDAPTQSPIQRERGRIAARCSAWRAQCLWPGRGPRRAPAHAPPPRRGRPWPSPHGWSRSGQGPTLTRRPCAAWLA